MIEKGLLVSSLCQSFSRSLLNLFVSVLSSLSVSHRPWSLSFWPYLLHPCEFSRDSRFSQMREQKLAETLSMPKREWRTVTLSLLFILPLKCLLKQYMTREFESYHCFVQVKPDSYQINLLLGLYILVVGLSLEDQFTARKRKRKLEMRKSKGVYKYCFCPVCVA